MEVVKVKEYRFIVVNLFGNPGRLDNIIEIYHREIGSHDAGMTVVVQEIIHWTVLMLVPLTTVFKFTYLRHVKFLRY
jgi:hypothetical protein